MNYDEFDTQIYNEPYAYFPKCFFNDERYKNLSIAAKLLYTFLFDRTKLSLQNGWLTGEGEIFVYCTVETVMNILNCCRSKAVKTLKELEDNSLIMREKIHLGHPDKIFVNTLTKHF